jgi:hypothetical protein
MKNKARLACALLITAMIPTLTFAESIQRDNEHRAPRHVSHSHHRRVVRHTTQQTRH